MTAEDEDLAMMYADVPNGSMASMPDELAEEFKAGNAHMLATLQVPAVGAHSLWEQARSDVEKLRAIGATILIEAAGGIPNHPGPFPPHQLGARLEPLCMDAIRARVPVIGMDAATSALTPLLLSGWVATTAGEEVECTDCIEWRQA